MELGAVVLDQHVIDRNGIPMGRVDGVVLQLRAGRPPRVARIVVGGPTLLRRISPVLAGWTERWRRRWGPSERGGIEVPWSKVIKVGIDVKVDLAAEQTPALAWERWVRERIIGRIPGA
jgi:sporulation protein YlmC with PRC-barrel domain